MYRVPKWSTDRPCHHTPNQTLRQPVAYRPSRTSHLLSKELSRARSLAPFSDLQ